MWLHNLATIDASNPVLVLGVVVLGLLAFLRGQTRSTDKVSERLDNVHRALVSQAKAQQKANELTSNLQEQVKELGEHVNTLAKSLLQHIEDTDKHLTSESKTEEQ